MKHNAVKWTQILLAGALAMLVSTASVFAQAGAGMAGGGLSGGGFGGGGIGGGGIGGGGLTGGGLSGGGGFAGSSSGGGLAGGSSFSGGGNTGAGGNALGFAGTGAAGNAGRPGAGAAGTSTTGTGVQATDPFRTYYANPYSMGYASGNGRTTFGQPVYTVTTVTGAGAAGAISMAPGGLVSGTSFPVRRAPAYVTTIGFEHTPPSPGKLEVELQDVIDRSSALRTKAAIRVKMLGQVAVLQGRVTDARSRRLAESLVRLTPGVRGVQNQLAIIKDTPVSAVPISN